jgi:ribonuclease PH
VGFLRQHPSSVLVSFGNTRVLVAASIEERVPPHRDERNLGWLTAEYVMLPAATKERKQRPNKGADARSTEIQRLIGRSLRQAVDIDAIGRRTILIDCDVIEADAGTRVAAITGGYVACVLSLNQLIRRKLLSGSPYDYIKNQVAAVSLAILGNGIFWDPIFEEDMRADMDFNLVGTRDGKIIEIQGTAEQMPVSQAQIDALMLEGAVALGQICTLQNACLAKVLG